MRIQENKRSCHQIPIGYSINQTEEDGNTIFVNRYQIHEVSLVAVPADPKARIVKQRSKAMNKQEIESVRNETTHIMQLGARYDMLDEATEHANRGKSLEDFRSVVLDRIGTKPLVAEMPADYLNLSDTEERQFSLARAIEAKASGDWRNAGFEKEVLDETGKRSKHGGMVLPPHFMRRDLTTGSPSNGSNMIQTDVLGGSFINKLYQASVVLDQCTTLSGNRGDIAIPKMATGTSAAWYTETWSLSESSPVISQIGLSPRTVAAFTELSRRMIQQSSADVESLLRFDMANQMATAIDGAIIQGGGSSEPSGVLETSGIGSVTLGTNGDAISYASLVNLVKEVAVDNALDGRLAFVTNPQVVASMRQTARQSSGVEGNFILNGDNSLLGYRVLATNNVPSDFTQGSGTGLSAVIFGNWADVLVAFWSNFEVLVDPYTKAEQNLVRVRAVTDVDVAIRNPESFAAITDVVAS